METFFFGKQKTKLMFLLLLASRNVAKNNKITIQSYNDISSYGHKCWNSKLNFHFNAILGFLGRVVQQTFSDKKLVAALEIIYSYECHKNVLPSST